MKKIAKPGPIGALYFNTNQTSEALQATRDQVGLSEQGQLTDRFSKAVEQLGRRDKSRDRDALTLSLDPPEKFGC